MSTPANLIFPLVGPHDPAQEIEKRALPCAVRTDEPQDLPFGEGEADIVDGHHAAEVPAYVLYLEERHDFTMARLRSRSRTGEPQS